MIHSITLQTPVAPFTALVADAEVVAAGFVDHADALRAGLPPEMRADRVEALDELPLVSEAVAKYLDGVLGALDEVPVRTAGTTLQKRMWAALRTIEPGRTMTYRQLAEAASAPRAVRAAGRACAANPVALFVPCHRVVRTDGGLGGYAYGEDVKSWLLRHEAGGR